MKYCADTWFLLKLAEKDFKTLEIKRNIIEGKDRLLIPTVVILELFRKLMQKGKKEIEIESFLRNLTALEKVKTIFLDELIAKESAKISISYDVPTVDSIVVGTYKATDADILLSDDEDIKKLGKKKIINFQSW